MPYNVLDNVHLTTRYVQITQSTSTKNSNNLKVNWTHLAGQLDLSTSPLLMSVPIDDQAV